MAKVHITPTGPARCDDTTGRCPYQHVEAGAAAEAMRLGQVLYEEQMEATSTATLSTKPKRKPAVRSASPKVPATRVRALRSRVPASVLPALADWCER